MVGQIPTQKAASFAARIRWIEQPFLLHRILKNLGYHARLHRCLQIQFVNIEDAIEAFHGHNNTTFYGQRTTTQTGAATTGRDGNDMIVA